MNTSSLFISELRKTHVNYLFYDNTFLLMTLRTRNNSHVIFVGVFILNETTNSTLIKNTPSQ